MRTRLYAALFNVAVGGWVLRSAFTAVPPWMASTLALHGALNLALAAAVIWVTPLKHVTIVFHGTRND